VANTSKASAEEAAAAAGYRGFRRRRRTDRSARGRHRHYHGEGAPSLEIAKAAIGAGKHVYCEWPLGNGLAEAEEMAALARTKGVLGVVGTQAPPLRRSSMQDI